MSSEIPSNFGKGALINTYLLFSGHARYRMAQRNYSGEDIRYIIEHGTVIYWAGAKWFILRRRDVPRRDRRQSPVMRLVGTIVCLEQGVMSTVFRHEDPLHYVLRKQKYYQPTMTRSVTVP